jgi:hypothetical protein
VAAVLAGVWLIVAPRTPDLAAQAYRVSLFEHAGLALWDLRWYGGHALPGYSLLVPPLAALIGLREVAVLAVLASALLFERLLATAYGPGRIWGVMFFALAAAADIWIGRVTFAVGVTFALAAALAFAHRRLWAAALLALACAAASPVAALLLALAALVWALEQGSPRSLAVLVAPAAALVLALALLFAEGGWEPFPLRSFAATAVVGAAFLAALPPGARVLRVGGGLYLLACALFLAVHTPVGSNIARFGVLLAGPLLLCAWLGEARDAGLGLGAQRDASGQTARPRLPPRALVALGLMAVWVVWGPVREVHAVAGSPATRASYYAPVARFLQGVPDAPVRVEVPLTRSHWEAALLAPHVALARGWEKQLEERDDRALLQPGLTPAAYRAWLHEQAVSYVALPDVPLDPSSAREGRLIRAGLPYLRLVFDSAHWRVYRVLAATPLAAAVAGAGGRLVALGTDSFRVRAPGPGAVVVRVRWTRYWQVRGAAACVRRAPGGWTLVSFAGGGEATVAARFSLGAAFGSPPACSGGPRSSVPR